MKSVIVGSVCKHLATANVRSSLTADSHVQQFTARIRPFSFYKVYICIEPSLLKAQYYRILLQIFFLQEFTH